MNIKQLIVLAPLALAATGALAQDNKVKIGYVNVQPNSSASDVTGPFTPTGLSLDVRPRATLFISYTRRINDNFDIEAAFGLPPTHDVNIVVRNPALPASAQALNGQVGARVRQVAPTVFLNYNFADKDAMLRPFIGLGVNYTTFDKADSTAQGNALNGGPTSLSLEDSFGLAAQVGLNMKLNDRWSLSAALSTASVRTKLTTNTLGILRSSEIKFRPTVFVLAAGFSF
jgi:outer membrane protein